MFIRYERTKEYDFKRIYMISYVGRSNDNGATLPRIFE